jgi:hypothetical protein
MKKLALLFSLATFSVCAQPTKISTLPYTSSGNPQDLTIIVQNGITKQVALSNIVFNNGTVLYGKTLVQTLLDPTNIYNGSGTISATQGSYSINSSSGAFAGWWPGYNLIVGPNSAQYEVMAVVNASNVIVYPQIGYWTNPPYGGFTNVSYIVYPNALNIADVNGNHAGWIDNGGAMGVIGGLGPDNAANGQYYIANGYNSWFTTVKSDVGNSSYWALSSLSNNPIMRVNNGAPYNSFWIMPDGTISILGALTNYSTGLLKFNGNILVNGPMSQIGISTMASLNVFNPTQGVSGSYGGYNLFSTNASTFANFTSGYGFFISNNYYVVTSILSPTNITITPYLTANYTNAIFSYYEPIQISSNSTTLPTSFLTQDGSLGLFSYGNSAGKIYIMNVQAISNVFTINSQSQYDGYRFQISTTNGAALTINSASPYDSLDIIPSGYISARFGLTNYVGQYLSLQGVGNIAYETNSQSTLVDLTESHAVLVTNASFAFVGFTNKSSSQYQEATLFVTNSSGGLIAFTAPGCKTNGVLNVTNVTRVQFTYSPDVRATFTNCNALPLF